MAKLYLFLCILLILGTVSHCNKWPQYSELSDDEYAGNYAIPGVTEPLLKDVMRQWDEGDDFGGDFGDAFGEGDSGGFGADDGFGSDDNHAGGDFGAGFGGDFNDFGANGGEGRETENKKAKGSGNAADFGKGFDKNFDDTKSNSADFFSSEKGGKAGQGFGDEFGSDFGSFDKGFGKGTRVPRSSAGSPEMPATCKCKKQRFGGGTCYFFTDESNGICARRDCLPKYVCVNGPSGKHGLLCMKRKTISKIVKTGQHTCVRKKTAGYMYVPYTET